MSCSRIGWFVAVVAVSTPVLFAQYGPIDTTHAFPNGVQLTVGPGVQGNGLVTTYQLAGDFDVQVHYTLLNWPATNLHSVRIGANDLGVGPGGGIGLNRSSFSNSIVNASEFYLLALPNGKPQIATTDTSGILRIVRTGGVLSGYANGTLVGSGTVSTAPTHIYIDLGGGDPMAKAGILIAFDNFVVNSGTPVFPGGSSTGTITITSTPRGAGFQIARNGSIAYSGTTPFTISSAPAGDYTITWTPLPGFTSPSSAFFQTLTAGGSVAFIGNYTSLTAGLTITSNVLGAAFTVTGPSTFSGQTLSQPLFYTLPIGSYTVSFSTVPGYVAPLPQGLSLLGGTSESVAGTYTLAPGTGTVIVTLNPPYVGFDMTGPISFSGAASATFSAAPAGEYRVHFIPSSLSGLPPPPVQDQLLLTNQTVLFSAKYSPPTVPIKVVSPGVCTPVTSNPFSFGGDVCISFEPKPGAPQGRQRGIIHIINGTGAWYSAVIARVANSVVISDNQLPSVFLLPPRGPNGYFDSSPDPSLYVEFGLGDSLVLDLQRDSIAAAATFSIDFISRVFLGTSLPTFSSTGLLSLVGPGAIAEAVGTLNQSGCAGSFTKFAFDSGAEGTVSWQDLGEALTCVAHDKSALAAMNKLASQLANPDQQSQLLGILQSADKVFTVLNFASHAISATESFGGYYAAPVRGELRLDAISRGK